MDLVLVILAAAISMALGFVPNVPEALRAVVALELVLFMPGYALVTLLFPNSLRDNTMRLVVVLGSSIAIAIVCGLVMNFLPWGLTRSSWSAALGIITIVLATLGLLRIDIHRRPSISWASLKIARLPAVQLVLAGMVLVGALGVARTSALSQQHTNFTQLWMLPAEQTSIPSVRLGIRNDEPAALTYRLQLRQGEQVLQEWS
ncbi:MAG TPA: DUF1616 domain-containing protein, partial [Roseiflexaceae bacterium]|nr:DUF1616 domain-containing protein [Roseiflexaceae bacterium]